MRRLSADARGAPRWKGRSLHSLRFRVLSPVLLVPVLLLGCRTDNAGGVREQLAMERSVAHQVVARENGPVYEQGADQQYIQPEPFASNQPPEFPAMADERLPSDTSVSVIVTLVVDEDGMVADVRPWDGHDADERKPFFEKVAAACLDWRFKPLMVRTTEVVPDGEVSGLPKVKVVTDVKALPFSIDYEFVFSEHGVVMGVQGT